MTHSYKLTFAPARYYVTVNDNGEKVTNCELSSIIMLPVPFTQRMVKKYKNSVVFKFMPDVDSNIISSCAIIDTNGSALCHKDDKFNFSTGKHLSETRAKKKAYDLSKRILEDLKNEYTKDILGKRNGSMIIAHYAPINQIGDSIVQLSLYLKDEEKHLENLKNV